MNFFYKLWADTMILQLKIDSKGKSWLLFSFIILSALGAINIGSIYGLIYFVTDEMPFFFLKDYFQSITGSKVAEFLWAFSFLLLPMGLINYILIIHKKKYEKLLLRQFDLNGKVLKFYFILSFFSFIIVSFLNKLK